MSAPLRSAALAAALALAAAAPARAAELTLLNPRGAGFSDQTPVTPQPLNPATTRGDQALIVFQAAGAIWGAALRSRVPIAIDAQFSTIAQHPSFACTSTGTVLASTGVSSYRTATSYPSPSAAYPVALASALSGSDLVPGHSHFFININADLGTSRCVFPMKWYFGLDSANPSDSGADGGTRADSLLSTLLHEFGHGLGFTSLVNPNTGVVPLNPSAFDFQVVDVATGGNWTQASDLDRKALAVTPGGIAFQGPSVQAGIPTYLGFPPTLAFATDAGTFSQPAFTVAEFSGALSGSAPLVAAEPLDACTPLTNAAQLAGKFVLIRRSFADADLVCSFVEKTNRAVAAGAAGVVVFDRTQEALIRMAGTTPISIPALFIGNDDGLAIQSRLAAEPVTVRFEPSAQRANTDPGGNGVLLFTPSAVNPGSSISHWNNRSYPRALLMEFAVQSDMRLGMDLTPDAMADLGWPVMSGLGVSVVKLLDAEVPAGAQASFLVAVLNRRHTDVSAVSLDLTLPAGTTLVSATARPDVCTGGFPCALGALPAGEVRLVVVTVKAEASASGPFAVTATVSPTPSSPADVLSDTITTTVGTGGDLEVTITPPAKLTPGSTATMTTTVTNKGPGAAVGVVLKGDIAGTGTPLPTVKSNSGGCNTSFPCALGTIAAGASLPVTTTLTVPEGAQSGTFTASVTQQSPEVATANDSASTALTIAGGCSSSGGSGSGLGLAVVAAGLLYGARRSRRRWSV